jgi:hypothetical protein
LEALTTQRTSIMTATITIQAKSVYGETKIYPVCSAAKEFASIAGNKTLTRATLAGVLRLGFKIIELDRYGQVCREHVAGSGELSVVGV